MEKGYNVVVLTEEPDISACAERWVKEEGKEVGGTWENTYWYMFKGAYLPTYLPLSNATKSHARSICCCRCWMTVAKLWPSGEHSMLHTSSSTCVFLFSASLPLQSPPVPTAQVVIPSKSTSHSFITCRRKWLYMLHNYYNYTCRTQICGMHHTWGCVRWWICILW